MEGQMQDENIVTKIEPLHKSRLKIYLDGIPRFILYRSEVRLYGIKEGGSISRETIDEIYSEVLLKRAKLRSLNLLKDRNYTEYRIREKLRLGFYPESIIDGVVAYAKSLQYIDDKRYTKDYILYYSESRSRKQIEQDLLKKGIGKELIREIYEEELGEEKLPEERQLIGKLLRKKHYDKASADYKTRQKMAAFLYRKGFSMDCVWEMI